MSRQLLLDHFCIVIVAGSCPGGSACRESGRRDHDVPW